MQTSQDKQHATKPAKVIAVVNQKGGVGKTTTAINLSTAFALEGFPTLLIDCDPQANTTGGIGLARDETRLSVYDLLSGTAKAEGATVPTSIKSLSIIPGSKNLIGANIELVGQQRREFRLRDAIAEVLGAYSFIVLDCPPALDLLTLNSLVAADGLLVPMQAEYFALEGISELMSTLDRVSQAFNPGLSLEGVLLTMYDDRTNLSQQVAANLREFFGKDLRKRRFRETSGWQRRRVTANRSPFMTRDRRGQRHTGSSRWSSWRETALPSPAGRARATRTSGRDQPRRCVSGLTLSELERICDERDE